MTSEFSIAEKDQVTSEFAFHQREFRRWSEDQRNAALRAEHHQRILHSLTLMYPFLKNPARQDQPESSADSQTPRGLAALRRVLSQRHGDWLSSVEVHQLLVERQWAEDTENGAAATRAALNRAVKMGQVEKKVDGRRMLYTWRGRVRSTSLVPTVFPKDD